MQHGRATATAASEPGALRHAQLDRVAAQGAHVGPQRYRRPQQRRIARCRPCIFSKLQHVQRALTSTPTAQSAHGKRPDRGILTHCGHAVKALQAADQRQHHGPDLPGAQLNKLCAVIWQSTPGNGGGGGGGLPGTSSQPGSHTHR